MEQKLNVGRTVHIDFYNGGSAVGVITMIGDVCTNDEIEKIYQLKVGEDNYINIRESQIEDIYDGFSKDNYEEFLEHITQTYKLGKLEPHNHGEWLPIVWNLLSDEEKQYFAVFFSSKEAMVTALNMIFNFEKEVLAIIRNNHKNKSKKKEDVISRFYGLKK